MLFPTFVFTQNFQVYFTVGTQKTILKQFIKLRVISPNGLVYSSGKLTAVQ